MAGYDVQEILSGFDNRQESLRGKTIKESLDGRLQENRETVRQRARDEQAYDDADAEQERIHDESYEAEYGSGSVKMGTPEYWKRLSSRLLNSTSAKNAQRMILMAQRDARRGLNKEMEPGRSGMRPVNSKSQVSTIAIPTQLLRYVQQEIGQLSVRTTQNDLLTGFLYWYFGKPEDVRFENDETARKIREITENLDLNASPAKFNRLNYNASTSLIDKLETLGDQIEILSTMATTAARDAIDEKAKLDKIMIVMCYNILNMLAFAPPVMPGERPEDIDLLANGAVWDLMSGIDTAYDYFKSRNGREIYKDQIRRKVRQAYAPPVQQAVTAMPSSDPDSYGGYEEPDSMSAGQDVPMDYDDDYDETYEDIDTEDFDFYESDHSIVKDNVDGLYSLDYKDAQTTIREAKKIHEATASFKAHLMSQNGGNKDA